MDILALLFYPIAITVGPVLAFRNKKQEGLVYTGLDKLSIALNVLLVVAYGFGSVFPVFLGMVLGPEGNPGALLTVIAYLLSALIAAAPLYCAIALGLSVSFRRKGRSLQGFLVQFAGILGIVLPFLLFSLLENAGLSWLSVGLN